MPQVSQPLARLPRQPVALQAVEVIAPYLLVDAPLLEDGVDDVQQVMGPPYRRPLAPPPRRQAAVLRRQVRPLAVTGRPGRLHQRGPQPAVALAPRPAQSLPGALAVG